MINQYSKVWEWNPCVHVSPACWAFNSMFYCLCYHCHLSLCPPCPRGPSLSSQAYNSWTHAISGHVVVCNKVGRHGHRNLWQLQVRACPPHAVRQRGNCALNLPPLRLKDHGITEGSHSTSQDLAHISYLLFRGADNVNWGRGNIEKLSQKLISACIPPTGLCGDASLIVVCKLW